MNWHGVQRKHGGKKLGYLIRKACPHGMTKKARNIKKYSLEISRCTSQHGSITCQYIQESRIVKADYVVQTTGLIRKSLPKVKLSSSLPTSFLMLMDVRILTRRLLCADALLLRWRGTWLTSVTAEITPISPPLAWNDMQKAKVDANNEHAFCNHTSSTIMKVQSCCDIEIYGL